MTSETVNEARLIATILSHSKHRAQDTALSCGKISLNWGELSNAVLRMAGALDARAGGNLGRVALLGTASVGLVIGYLGTVAAGGCAVPLPVSAHPDTLANMLANCEPDVILAQEEYRDLVAPAFTDRTISLGKEQTENFMEAFPGDVPALAQPREPGPDAPFNIIYSSGTTGRPKGIVHSHKMRYRQAARSLFEIDTDSTMLLATPLYSNTTLMPMLAALFYGGRVVMMPKFDAEAYLDLAERERATHTMLVPVQYDRILSAESFSSRDLSTFRVKQSTGALLRASVKAEIVEKWPGRLFEVYGLTEGGCTCILDVTSFPHKGHTVGRPAAGNEIYVIDDEGNRLPPGERGEIIGRSATMMSGYFRNEEETAAFRWRDADGTLFHRTGDVGMFDEDGFLILLDRKKDMIVSGGFNIYASDLEEKLLDHPDVAEAAVIAVPSERWGETPLGLVVPRPGAHLEPAALLEWVNERLGRTQRLSAIEVREALPRSSIGKVLKQELKKPYWKDEA